MAGLAGHLLGKGRKAKVVKLGKKGSFKIKHPGAFTAKAKRAGMTVPEAAQKWKSRKDKTGRQAISAIGFAAMKKG